MKHPFLGLMAIALMGCGASMTFTRVGDALPAKPANCEVAVLTAAPSGSYQELGTINVEYKSQTDWISKPDEFQRKAQPLVCNAGGDAVIARTNDYGVYLKGTVLSTQAAPADKQPTAATNEAGGESVDSTDQP